MRTLRDIIIGLILGAAFAIGGTWLYDQYRSRQAEQEQQALQYERQRQQHRDSLMNIRRQQEEAQRAENRKEIEERVVVRFLTEFYNNAILADRQQANSYKAYLSDACLQKLSEVGGSTGLAWWLFRTDAQAPDLESLRHHLRITPETDGWYRIHLVQQGATEFRRVRVLMEGNSIVIDDVR